MNRTAVVTASMSLKAWVALPEARETSPPRFQLARPDEIPEVVVGGATLRVLIGEMRGSRSPIETSGARAVFFADGSGALDRAGVDGGTLAVMHDGDAPVLRLEPRTIALIFGGVSLGRRYMQGNFIASTEARLDAALRRVS